MSEIRSQGSGNGSQEDAEQQPRCEVFFGAASPAEARVYARGLTSGATLNAGSLKLAGRLVGPQCEFANTLPARLPLLDRSTKNECLAEAIVPDPCFWTPELPFLYRAELELLRDGQSIKKYRLPLGIRRFGARGRSLQFEGARFVLRGGWAQMGSGEWKVGNDEETRFARESWTATVIHRPSDEWCEMASSRGVLTIADFTGIAEPSALEAELHRVAKWPAVVIALLDQDASPPAQSIGAVRNLTLAQYAPSNTPLALADWAKIAFVEVSDPPQFAEKIAHCEVPIVAVRQVKPYQTLTVARSACDRLQADLAPHGDFAGYIVR